MLPRVSYIGGTACRYLKLWQPAAHLQRLAAPGAGKWLLVVNSAGGNGNGIVYDPPPSALVEGVTYFNAEYLRWRFHTMTATPHNM